MASLTAHDPASYNTNAAFVYSDAFTAPVLSMLNAKAGERILDLGCGSGEITARLAAAVGPEGSVWGVDSNSKMLSRAREQASTRDRDSFFQCDIQKLVLPSKALEHSFDAVFSNAALHWCKDNPAGVLEGVKLALKRPATESGTTATPPRFVCEMGGFLNCIGVRSHCHAVLRERGYDPNILEPYFFPTDDEYRKEISLVPRITPLKTGLIGWLRTFFRDTYLAGVADEEAEGILEEIVKRCEPDCFDSFASEWRIMYVRLRFVAILAA